MPQPASCPDLTAIIHLDRLRSNVAMVRARVPAHVQLLGVVKCDAYGHGAIPIARALKQCMVDHLVVGSITEGIALRQAGLTGPILVLSDPLHPDLRDALTHDLTLTVADEEFAARLARLRVRPGQVFTVHLKVDTGLFRFGVDPGRAEPVMADLAKMAHVRVEGLYSHLSSTFHDDDASNAFTRCQINAFGLVCEQLEEQGLLPPMVHLGSSTGLLGFPDELCSGRFNALRVGTLFYGFLERPNTWTDRPRPIAELTTRIMQVRAVRTGDHVGYHRAHRMVHDGRIAVIHGGYTQGLHGDLAWNFQPLVQGRPAMLIGKPALAQSLLDVSHAQRVKPGDEVLLAGEAVNMRTVGQVLGRSTWELLAPMLQAASKIYPRL
ncbi:alanine racemase [Desulfonatronum thiodismutans]|uniref:alanine racemase n=1 Tax=Desulfonatronum thiodismutans TaxID=159290 RepID=UPI0004ABDAD8|nr:alanine racemase [Desulfonatronum thiodismutans]